MDNNPKPADIVILASGAVIFVFSFFNWLGEGDFTQSAWGDGLFPLLTLPAIFGLVMAVQIALDRFANVDFPEEVAGFTWTQIHLVLAVYAVLIMVTFLIRDTGGLDRGFGYWISLLASFGLVAGAVMLHTDTGATGTPGGGAAPPPPQQF